MDAVLKRFSYPHLPGLFRIIQYEGQNAKITGFYVPCKKKVKSPGEARETFQELLQLGLPERMLVDFPVCVLQWD